MTSIGLALSGALVQFLWQGAVVALAVLATLPVVTGLVLYRPAADGGGPVSREWTLPLWAAGVVLFSCRPILSLMRIRALRRKGTEPERWIAELGAKVAARMGCTRAFRILMCAVSETPAAIGWLRPVILLPAATVAGLSVEQLETILAHEIAHIRRHDYLVNVLQVVVETLLFYHPAVWWISSRIRFERELCCDDEVVLATGDAVGYARALASLERLRMPAAAPALGAGGALSYRVRRLMGVAAPSRELWPAMMALVLAIGCLTVGVRWVRAQEAQDKVTVEVTRDEQGSITGVRVISGPEYLRPLALMAALQQPVQAHAVKLPPELRVRTFTFPDALKQQDDQQAAVRQFLEDGVAQEKKDVEEQRNLELAREKLVRTLRQQELSERSEVAVQRSEEMWKVQVLRHEMNAFREQYQGKLQEKREASLEKRYAEMQKALAAAEQDLEGGK